MVTKKRKSYQTIAFLIFLFVLAIGAVGFLIVTNWKISQKRAELQEKIDILNKELEDVEEKAAGLRADIVQTETDDFQTEKLYEEGYFPEGAAPIVVLPSEQEAVEEEELTEEKNPWQRFLEKLGF